MFCRDNIEFDEEPQYETLKSILAVKETLILPKITKMVYSKIEMSTTLQIEIKIPIKLSKV